MKPLKQPKTYDEQIEILIEKHGLIIKDKNYAKTILSRVNYYRLSAYGIGLREPENKDRYTEGATLEQLYNLYQFDEQLRGLLFGIIQNVEIELRTRIAYHVASQYGADGYMHIENFVPVMNRYGELIHESLIRDFENEVVRQRGNPFVAHHLDIYGGEFPIWAAVELFSFGMLSKLYMTMKIADRKAIAKFYGTDAHYMGSWIASLVDMRNICAHYGRVYNRPFTKSPRLYSEYRQYMSNRLFPVILTLKRINNHKWDGFASELIELIGAFPDVNLAHVGFPENWIDVIRA